jgi:hypothetical protein
MCQEDTADSTTQGKEWSGEGKKEVREEGDFAMRRSLMA